MALPFGKKSIVQIQRRRDPIRRIVELATLLEWLLRLQPPKHVDLQGCPSLPTVASAYYADDPQALRILIAAIDVRNRLVHCVPGTTIPSTQDIQSASDTLTGAISVLLKSRRQTVEAPDLLTATWQAANDPLGELPVVDLNVANNASDEIAELQTRIRTALWRLDVVSGIRAPFTLESLNDSGTHARLQRYSRYLTSTSLSEVEEALSSGSSQSKNVLISAASSLESGLDATLAFDAQWTIAPGVLPIPAIRLEPDRVTRVRHLATLVEHLLAWIVPGLTQQEGTELLKRESGVLFETLLERNGHLLPDPEEVQRAFAIRNRLVRVVPAEAPVLSAEVEQSEYVLWHAAYELRRHADLEHSDAISRYDDAALRTVPRSQMWSIKSPIARVEEQVARLRGLAMAWLGKHPGGWPVAASGRVEPSISEMLCRHPWQELHDAFPIMDAVERYFEPNSLAVAQCTARSDYAAWDKSIVRAIHLLEEELGWMDRPKWLKVKCDSPPDIQPTLRPIPKPPELPPPEVIPAAIPLSQRYPLESRVMGVVDKLETYGAFVRLTSGETALLHISEMSWSKVSHPRDLVAIGQAIECTVLSVDDDRKKVGLSLSHLFDLSRYAVGNRVQGKVQSLASYGFLVELEPGVTGLVHIREVADHFVSDVSEEVKVGEQVTVLVISVDIKAKKIGLSLKQA